MADPTLPDSSEAERYAVGPDSVTWRRASDARAFFGAGTALILQVAHPTVGAGVAHYSDFLADPWGRLFRTLDYLNQHIYGGPQRAAAVARGVREMHKDIKGVDEHGRRYHALEPGAYAWVHATLAWSIVEANRRFGRPFSDAEKVRFYEEWRGLGRLLGVRSRDLPEDWAGFLAYFDGVVASTLEDNQTVRDVLTAIGSPAAPPLPGLGERTWKVLRLPAARAQRLATIWLLPPALREKLGLELTPAQLRELRATSALSRSLTPVLPQRVKLFGPAYLEWRGDRVWTASRLPGVEEATAA